MMCRGLVVGSKTRDKVGYGGYEGKGERRERRAGEKRYDGTKRAKSVFSDWYGILD